MSTEIIVALIGCACAVGGCIYTLLKVAHENGKQTQKVESAVQQMSILASQLESFRASFTTVAIVQNSLDQVKENNRQLVSEFKELKRRFDEMGDTAMRSSLTSHHDG